MRLVLVLLLAGCSSVPDVTFADGDAAVDAGAHAVDAGLPVDAGHDAGPAYSCPDHAPPASAGICCGSRLCLNCNIFQCDRCAKEACSASEACCAKGSGLGGGVISCTAATACN